jgi:hydrogenase maturation factor
VAAKTGGLSAGKLPPRLLARLLRWRGASDRRVLVGPGCGVDAAVIAVGSHRLILKSDPVTFTALRVGWYAVHVNANDVAVMGGRPAWFQPTILVPPGTRASSVTAIARDIDAACRVLGVAVTGGHTEVTDAVTRPVVAGDMQGLLLAPRVVTSTGARPGDLLLLTKAAGIEGTAVLAQECARDLSRTRHGRCSSRLSGYGISRGSPWSPRPSSRLATVPRRCTIRRKAGSAPGCTRSRLRRECGSTSIST